MSAILLVVVAALFLVVRGEALVPFRARVVVTAGRSTSETKRSDTLFFIENFGEPAGDSMLSPDLGLTPSFVDLVAVVSVTHPATSKSLADIRSKRLTCPVSKTEVEVLLALLVGELNLRRSEVYGLRLRLRCVDVEGWIC